MSALQGSHGAHLISLQIFLCTCGLDLWILEAKIDLVFAGFAMPCLEGPPFFQVSKAGEGERWGDTFFTFSSVTAFPM